MLYSDVFRNLFVEIHSATCKDVDKARAKGFMCGTVEGDSSAQAIENHIRNMASSGIDLERNCYRVMPCCK